MRNTLYIISIIMIILITTQSLTTIVYANKPDVWILAGKGKKHGKTQPPQTIPWGVTRIHAPDAWGTSTGLSVQVAVLDTGVDKDHPDLSGNVVWGISVVGNKESTKYRDWKDKNGHGTHVAGTIAALNNQIGVVGVGYNISIYAIKVLSDSGYGSWTDLAEGIIWALKGPDGIIDKDGDGIAAGDPDDDAAEVISMSLGGTTYSAEVENAVNLAYSYGAVLVAAAGNEGASGVTYPAKLPNVIAVAAIDKYDSVPSWSSKGPEVELAAPGVDILSTVPHGGYKSYSGTSMATPHVSATAALVISKLLIESRQYTPDYIRQTLINTAEDIGAPGWDSESGYGVVRADLAVSTA